MGRITALGVPVAAEPLNALDAGFQLSFAGVAGLLAYRRRLGQSLPGIKDVTEALDYNLFALTISLIVGLPE